MLSDNEKVMALLTMIQPEADALGAAVEKMASVSDIDAESLANATAIMVAHAMGALTRGLQEGQESESASEAESANEASRTITLDGEDAPTFEEGIPLDGSVVLA
jgi:hypothetical protein